MQGSEQYHLFLKPISGDASTADHRAVEVSQTADGRPPVWATDGSGFFYTTRAQTLNPNPNTIRAQTAPSPAVDEEGKAMVVRGRGPPCMRSDSLWRVDVKKAQGDSRGVESLKGGVEAVEGGVEAMEGGVEAGGGAAPPHRITCRPLRLHCQVK